MPAKVSEISFADVLSWGACAGYDTHEQLDAITPGEGEIYSPLEVLALDIPLADRQWVLCRGEVMRKRDLRAYAIDCLEHVAHHWHKAPGTDFEPLQAIVAARQFQEGTGTRAELRNVERAAKRDARGPGPAMHFEGMAKPDPREAARAAAHDALTIVHGVAARRSNREQLTAGQSPDKASRIAAASAAGLIEQDWQTAQLATYLTPRERR